ncbi:hypothetical protein ACJJTC_002370 [Scirpophaga incertulas]
MEKPSVTEQPPPYSATVPPAGPPPGVPAGATPGQAPGYPAPPPMYTPYGTVPNAPPGTTFVPNYGATSIIIQPPIVTVGACPACRVGILEDDFTCLGILCAILFFPLGILCCLALKNRRCTNCGAMYA